jgi:hypothetical protein
MIDRGVPDLDASNVGDGIERPWVEASDDDSKLARTHRP